MINELKKHTKTYKKFETYMERFNYSGKYFDDVDVDYSPESFMVTANSYGHDVPMPEQFLIGCLMEFVISQGECQPSSGFFKGETVITSTGMDHIKDSLIIAFEILEEKLNDK